MESPAKHIAIAISLVAIAYAAPSIAKPSEEGQSRQPKIVCRLDSSYCPLGRCETQQRKPKPRPTSASEVAICSDAGLVLK